VLLRICGNLDRRKAFYEYLGQVFTGCRVDTTFDHANDLWIHSTVSLPGHIDLPLDMAGTGVLQAVQLLAYVTNYSPKLLLLDEPDAHLHPNNQRLLAKTLGVIAENTDTTIVLATHSRHLLDALSELDSARLYWVRDGSAERQENWSDVAVLMDLGALDRGERFLAGNYRYLVWTEDIDTRYLEAFLAANGVPQNETLIFSYQASSKIDAAGLMARFVERIRPGVRTIIHRDRDFMTDDEVDRMKEKYWVLEGLNARVFVTKNSDMEAYFAQPDHVHNALGIPLADARILVETAVRENSNEFVLKFRDKREEIKRDLYRADPDNCPATDVLLPGNQVPIEKALGKLLLK
jgi:AAA ATPase domain